MLFKALILVCLLPVQPVDCTTDTAHSVLQGPDAETAGQCLRDAQKYFAGTTLARELLENEYVRVNCRRTVMPPLGLAERE